ncbi:proenkephalin-A-like [Parambassis ranga]|uniref:Proenkephalin-A-like n=1 Tax=Parambassis ranga TaxID=210632 RepID=A0A6P7K392_9TELE|nr:proenkephalin-A [Parambassis ranga]
MASASSNYMWMLVLGVCVSLVVGIDCGKECALCVYHLLGQKSTFTSLTCSIECEGVLDNQKLRICKDILLEEENQIPLDVDPHQQQVQEGGVNTSTDDVDTALLEPQMSKKYGGFMKRYGGFMSRRSTLPGEIVDGPENHNKEENVRLEILKILNAAAEHSSEGEGQGGETMKRYGGFMRRVESGVPQGSLLEAVLGRGLKKRYGGFMRRVGRPEWLVDNSKNGGALKRAWEVGSELQKRYGGFMD